MLTTEQPCSESSTAICSPPTYALRLHGGTEDERLLPIPLGKHSIGSGPRSSLRLQREGVQPLECLIVRDDTGLRVRRWSDTTLVNGQPFDDVRLTPGDRLTMGSLELEVIAPESGEEFTAEVSRPKEHRQVARPAETLLVSSAAREEFERRAAGIARRRSRRVLAALRRQRQEHDELLGRVDELVRKVESVVVERPVERPVEPSPTEGRRTERVSEAELLHKTENRVHQLADELGSVREQLAARDVELAQARFSIDALERQLIDSQHTLHAFVEERVSWESQFNELESRLSEYVRQIQDLESQLEQVRTAQAEAASAPPAEIAECVSETPATEPPHEEHFEEQSVAVAEEPPAIEKPQACEAAQEVASETPPETAGEVVNESISEPGEAVVVGEGLPEDEAQVDAALEHLRGLSIWREEAEAAAETRGENSASAAAEECAPPKPVESGSFIDRYAHLFPPEDAASDPSPAMKPPAPVQPPAPARVEEPSNAHDGTHSDEESVEQYMARLLERMRGPSTKPATEDESAEMEPSTPVEPVALAEESQPAHAPITDIEELRSKVAAPERTSDIAAMRALANQSARHAIGVHTASKLRRSARTRTVIALLGAAVGIYLLLDAPGWKSLQFASGCLAAVIALYWGKLTFSTLIEGIRLGAFDDDEKEIAPASSLRPPLPIDVADSTKETASGEQPAVVVESGA